MKFHRDGSLPENGKIFVFGSNLAGAHGAGAAKVAHEAFGARLGVGVGRSGQAYAIPTKDQNLRTIPLFEIKPFIDEFINYAKATAHNELQFFVTAIGCGLAGYHHDQIAPMFWKAPDNCSFPDVWSQWLGEADR